MKLFAKSVFACLILLQAALVNAVPIINSPTGILAPGHVITFDELGNLQGQVISNQFAALGATFQNTWWDNATRGQAGSTGFVGGDLVSGVPGTLGGGGIIINFNQAVTDAAAAMVDLSSQFSVTSYLNNAVVETFNVLINQNPGNGWLGFGSSLFDEIRILPTNQTSALAIDTLQFNQSVPLPGTLLLLGLGFLGLGLTRRGKA